MSNRIALAGFAVSLMTVLCLVWGAQQAAIKAVLPFLSPYPQVGVRSAAAAVILILFVLWRSDTPWLAGEFLCASVGLLYTSASRISVFL